MNWISEVVRPKIKTLFKRESPDNLWIKCPDTGQMVFHKDVEANGWVIPGSNHHMRLDAVQRLKMSFGRVDELPMTLAVQDFGFMGGSLGTAAGEAFIKGADIALDKRTPYVLFAASGGARMQEGILSLMQMPRTTVAVRRLKHARLPYIVVLTNPTTGGVTASYAMLGDIHLAEPGALIGFAGPRVIEQTIREKLPDGFQRAEYLKEHGMVDMVVHRHDLKGTIARLCRLLTKTPVAVPMALAAE